MIWIKSLNQRENLIIQRVKGKQFDDWIIASFSGSDSRVYFKFN